MIHEILIHWELCWLTSFCLPYYSCQKFISFFLTLLTHIYQQTHFYTCDVFLPELKHAFIVTVCFSLLTFPSIEAAPTLGRRSISMSLSKFDSTPRWWNPCGFNNENGVTNSEPYIPKLNIRPIVIQVNIDRESERIFSGEFVSIIRPCSWLDGLTPSVKGNGLSSKHFLCTNNHCC